MSIQIEGSLPNEILQRRKEKPGQYQTCVLIDNTTDYQFGNVSAFLTQATLSLDVPALAISEQQCGDGEFVKIYLPIRVGLNESAEIRYGQRSFQYDLQRFAVDWSEESEQ